MRIKPFSVARFIVVFLSTSAGLFILSGGGKFSPPWKASPLKLGICLAFGLLAGSLAQWIAQLWREEMALKYYRIFLYSREANVQEEALSLYERHSSHLSQPNLRVKS
jgi:hypothetical protein